MRSVREWDRKTRAQFAMNLSTDTATIINIEHGRSPLRYELALTLCARYMVNPRWLATGCLPVHFHIGFYGQPYQRPPRTPFSLGYRDVLASSTEATLKAAAEKAHCKVEELDRALAGNLGATPDEIASTRRNRFAHRVVATLMQIPPSLSDLYIRRFATMSEGFFVKHSAQIKEYQIAAARQPPWEFLGITEVEWLEFLSGAEKQQEETKKDQLDESARTDNSLPAMKPLSLAEVLAEVARLTEAPGAQASLAKALGVPRQRVNDWATGKRSPNGKMALRLAAWVSAPEQKTKKSADRVAARSTQKIQKNKSKTNEKAKSDRPKG